MSRDKALDMPFILLAIFWPIDLAVLSFLALQIDWSRLAAIGWVCAALGAAPWAALAVALFVERRYPAPLGLRLVKPAFWFMLVAMILAIVMRQALVFTTGMLASILLLVEPAAVFFLIRTREQRLEFEASVARGESVRQVVRFPF